MCHSPHHRLLHLSSCPPMESSSSPSNISASEHALSSIIPSLRPKHLKAPIKQGPRPRKTPSGGASHMDLLCFAETHLIAVCSASSVVSLFLLNSRIWSRLSSFWLRSADRRRPPPLAHEWELVGVGTGPKREATEQQSASGRRVLTPACPADDPAGAARDRVHRRVFLRRSGLLQTTASSLSSRPNALALGVCCPDAGPVATARPLSEGGTRRRGLPVIATGAFAQRRVNRTTAPREPICPAAEAD